MRYDADYLLGRVFSMPLYIGNTISGRLHVTIVAYDPHASRVRVHGDDGSKEYWPLEDLIALIEGGDFSEATVAPFVIDRPNRRRH